MAGEKMDKPAAPSAPSGGGASSESRLWAAIGYVFWLLPIVVMVTEKKSDKWLLFHAYQSLIFNVVAWVVVMVTSAFLIGCLIAPVWLLAALYFGYKAYQGEKFLLPTIGPMAEQYASK